MSFQEFPSTDLVKEAKRILETDISYPLSHENDLIKNMLGARRIMTLYLDPILKAAFDKLMAICEAGYRPEHRIVYEDPPFPKTDLNVEAKRILAEEIAYPLSEHNKLILGMLGTQNVIIVGLKEIQQEAFDKLMRISEEGYRNAQRLLQVT